MMSAPNSFVSGRKLKLSQNNRIVCCVRQFSEYGLETSDHTRRSKESRYYATTSIQDCFFF